MKVFTCAAPYPVDVFVRLSLRDRGWVEKFGPRMLSLATATETSDKELQCSTDEGNIPGGPKKQTVLGVANYMSSS